VTMFTHEICAVEHTFIAFILKNSESMHKR
jgi:hypothetical protein